ncbi:transposase [Streptomyces sp. 3N207]|uniref:transposase n=1 Tax=Streptomyces sp. 3N207 TaxID=3457417 RepID=UPI003FD4C963
MADAVLCADGPVRSLVELSLVGEHRRGHGSLYSALSTGRVDVSRLRRALAAVPLPRAADGRLVLAADITCWLRPDAHTSPERILCHTYGRGKDQHIPVPGWPYSVICALETGRSSWTAPLDALRLAPGDDGATVTARQMRELIERLIEAGQWRQGDLDILVMVDAGYDVPRLAFLLKDLPVQVLAGCARTVSCAGPHRRANRTPWAARRVTAASSSSATRPPGAHPMPRPRLGPDFTARPPHRHGTGSTRG